MNLAPLLVQRFVDNNGEALIGGLLYSYAAGTSVPIATYTDSTGGTANSNPVVANARGEANVWINPILSYKFVLTDQYGSLIWSVDNVALFAGGGGVGLPAPPVNSIQFNSAGVFGGSASFVYVNGNVGLGGNPSAWNATERVFEMPGLFLDGGDPHAALIGNNAYFDAASGWRYKANGFATFYTQTIGTNVWYRAVSGLAGNPIVWIASMTITDFGIVQIASALEVTGNVTVGGVINGLQAVTPIAVATHAVVDTESIITVTVSPCTVTLLTAVGRTGRVFTIDNASPGNITVNTSLSELIEGALTQTVPKDSAMTVYSTGAGWRII
jgi:hypothetical protein